MRSRFQIGFTLVELLIVIAIIGILAGIVMVSMQSRTEKARIAKLKSFSSQVQHRLGMEAAGRWEFENSMNDSSGQGKNGTLKNGATYATDDEKNSRALLLSGGVGPSYDYAEVPQLSEIKDRGTISMWVKPDFAPGILVPPLTTPEKILFVFNDGNQGTGVNWFMSVNSSGYLSLFWSSGTYGPRYDVRDWNVGEWHHVVGIWDQISREAALFIDGLKVVTGDTALTPSASGNPMMIGWCPAGGCSPGWQGSLDDLTIYKEKLSSAEIQKLYVQGLPKYGLAKETAE
ncbi:MAG: LamG domain-containing protein [Candidatus Wildermuthbacteria bacterium]|nr:LamG domain-containing protein [Candidatus Wildermuthbacteria bacterium]